MADAVEPLEELHLKYSEILSMRLSDMSADGRASEAEVRARMAVLAARFPGALREIDDLALDEIQGRLDRLRSAMDRRGPIEPWMLAVGRFHRLTRGALCAKGWLRGRKHIDTSVERAYLADAEKLAFPEDALAWASELSKIAAPPSGRVTHLVYARIAQEMSTTEREAKRLVFGLCRRHKRRTD